MLALLLASLFVFGTVMALRTLRAAAGLPAGVPPGVAEPPEPPGGRGMPPGAGPSYDLHAFYYAWYGSPRFEGRYLHWDHALVPHWDPKVSASYPRGRHRPPDDIGSSFYPALGPYSSRDPAVVDEHMGQLRDAAIGKSRGPAAPLQPPVPCPGEPKSPWATSPGEGGPQNPARCLKLVLLRSPGSELCWMAAGAVTHVAGTPQGAELAPSPASAPSGCSHLIHCSSPASTTPQPQRAPTTTP